jgi:hypothetical protein
LGAFKGRWAISEKKTFEVWKMTETGTQTTKTSKLKRKLKAIGCMSKEGRRQVLEEISWNE